MNISFVVVQINIYILLSMWLFVFNMLLELLIIVMQYVKWAWRIYAVQVNTLQTAEIGHSPQTCLGDCVSSRRHAHETYMVGLHLSMYNHHTMRARCGILYQKALLRHGFVLWMAGCHLAQDKPTVCVQRRDSLVVCFEMSSKPTQPNSHHPFSSFCVGSLLLSHGYSAVACLACHPSLFLTSTITLL